ncbi:hypothetical protein Salat_0204000 [Sesamum alatum]|uniref:Uncharacterized protein n=1 Tax=Sesamum alatum TaxID=300844 RepID=A0AAE2CY46_9LAMI|nr:hypothetical protein Salat_0204000 [Sesamum alatum]
MALSADELQRNRFYNENWTVAMESTFLGVLVQQITMGVAEPEYLDTYAIKVLCLPGVLYDPITKELSADQFVWDTTMERSPWIRIYVNKADPAWDDLSTIFTNPVDFHVKFQDANVHVPENAVHDAAERFLVAKAYEHFGEPNYTALRAIFEGCVPHGARPSRRGCNNEVIDVDVIVELSSGSDDN